MLCPSIVLLLSLRLAAASSSQLAKRQETDIVQGPVINPDSVANLQQIDFGPGSGGTARLLIGGGPSGTIATATFDGVTFTIVANNTMAGTAPSWLLARPDGSNNLYAVDENSNTTRLFDADLNSTTTPQLLQNATGSSGVVFLELNADGTRMVGAAFGGGALDVWDVSAPDGQMKLISTLPSNGTVGPNKARQDKSHVHQAILDPSGRFFVANDLGTDEVLVLDTDKADGPAIVAKSRIEPAGCGPRHGVFFPPGSGQKATHYLLLCEMLSLVQVFEVEYDANGAGLQLNRIQSLSTYGPGLGPANATSATAGEIALSDNGQHVYVSNRLTGNATDFISHFAVITGVVDDSADSLSLKLAFRDSISSGGNVPRMFSLAGGAEQFVFVANQDGAFGLAAFQRNEDGGLISTPVASLPLSVFGSSGKGPQFVHQI